jgi:predicted metal-binding membrane protein
MAVIQEELRPLTSAAVALPAIRTSARRTGVWFAAVGWGALTLMWITGSADVFGHDQGRLSAILAIGLFLVGWTVMVAAMMLPSTLPTLQRVDETWGARGSMAPARFMGGYFLAWGAFGAAAFAGDGILHLLVDDVSWLEQRPSLIAGGVAMFAGAAELLGRTPPPTLPKVRAGAGSFALGNAHAVDRIRRCWPLMLFAMAVGMSNPVWMMGLTLVMALELRPRASKALRLAGLLLFGLGITVIVQPGWLPVLLGG